LSVKKFLYVIVFLVISSNLGLSQQITFGIVNSLDFNLYRFYNSDYLQNRYTVKPDLGWTFGISALYNLNNNFIIQSGLSVTTKQLVPDLNKVTHIFESVHYTSIELPLRAKYRVYSFSKTIDNSISDKSKSKKRSKKHKKKNKLFDGNAVHLYAIAGLTYSQMINVKPQYFDDGNVVYEPLEKQKTLYPEIGIGLSKKYLDSHLFTLDFIGRYSRNPFVFSTSVVEKANVEIGYFYTW